MSKTKSPLRYDIDIFSRQIVEELAKNNDLIELKPDYFTGTNHEHFYSLKYSLHKRSNSSAVGSYNLTGLRRVRTEKTWTIFYDY